MNPIYGTQELCCLTSGPQKLWYCLPLIYVSPNGHNRNSKQF
jgi:hypothetical protein